MPGETSIHATATRLMLVAAIDAQSLEKDHRSAGEHLRRCTKELQAVSQLHGLDDLQRSLPIPTILLLRDSVIHWGPNLNASTQMCAA